MHDPREGHIDAVYQILRYLKNAPEKGLIFRKNGHLNIEGYCDSDWASYPDDRKSTSGYYMFVGGKSGLLEKQETDSDCEIHSRGRV
jgi:hypothetical protein